MAQTKVKTGGAGEGFVKEALKVRVYDSGMKRFTFSPVALG